MKIQSLSVVVPNTNCMNHCKFCVSRMHGDNYRNQLDENLPFFDLYLNDYLKRLEFARHNGCNTVMLTGNSEPQQNRKFLTYFGMFMKMMSDPFQWIEMQTTGALLDENFLRFLRNHVGVNLISLSVSAFKDEINKDIVGMPENVNFNLVNLCSLIKKYDFNLRLSLNMTKVLGIYCKHPRALFRTCKDYGADQVTLREMYSSGNNTDQDKWLSKNGINIDPIIDYVKENGTLIGVLPYGAKKYSVHGMCVVIDNDCMSKVVDEDQENYKYLILQPNCKLYSRWDDSASLIF